MNILHLVPKAVFDGKVSRVRFEEAAALAAHPGTRVHTSGPGWPDWPDGLNAQTWVAAYHDERKRDPDREPHLILAYAIADLPRPPVTTAVVLHETYNHVKTLAAIRGAGASLAFFSYANDIERYRPELEAEGRLALHLPHGADGTIYRDWDEPKYIDVLIVGNLSQQFYPQRARLARLATRVLAKRGWRVETLPHPGFVNPPRHESFTGEEYARWLNRSKLVVTCTGKHKYAFAKLAEIPLCRSLAVSDLPAEREAFFDKLVVRAEPWMLDREILWAMEAVLDDSAELERRTTQAHDLATRHLTLAGWAERFLYAVRVHAFGEHPPAPTPATDEEVTS